MHPNIPGLIRLPVFAALLVFALIVLGLDGHLVAKLHHTYDEGFFKVTINAPAWAKLGVATSVLTLVSLLPMLIIDFLRKGAPTSLVAVELVWLGFLWILWLATAADTANHVDCGGSSDPICSQAQAAEAFSWLSWIVMTAYWAILLAFSFIAHSKGNSRIWTGPVTDSDFAGTGPVNHAPATGQVSTGATHSV